MHSDESTLVIWHQIKQNPISFKTGLSAGLFHCTGCCLNCVCTR